MSMFEDIKKIIYFQRLKKKESTGLGKELERSSKLEKLIFQEKESNAFLTMLG